MNKGLKLRFCKECGRKRFCKRERIPGHNFRFTCNKGHQWVLEGLTTERMQAAIEDIILPGITELFNKDDSFYSVLRKR